MEAIVLCGGFAKRLWPLTKNIAKPLLPINGKPILEYVLKHLERLKCIEKIHISVNKKFEKQFERFLEKRGCKKLVEIITEPSRKEEEKLGSIGALRFLMEKKSIGEEVIIVAGDNLFDSELDEAVEFFHKVKRPVIVLYDYKDKKRVRKRFGVAVLDEKSRIIAFEEKPDSPKSTLISTGLYLLPKNVLKFVLEYLKGENNPDAPGFFFQWLHKKMEIYGFVLKGNWFDIGSPEDYKRADKFYRKSL